MTPQRLFFRLLPLAAALLAATAAQASVISHDTITGQTYSDFGLYAGYFGPFDKTALVGVRFTAAASGYIDALTLSAFGAESYSLTLFDDNAGQIGNQLQTLAMTGSAVIQSFSSGHFTGGTQLNAGDDYWLVMGRDFVLEHWFYMNGAFDPGAIALGEASGATLPGTMSFYGTTSRASALGLVVSIDDGLVSSVPEPSSYALAGIGLLFAAAAARRRTAPQA